LRHSSPTAREGFAAREFRPAARASLRAPDVPIEEQRPEILGEVEITAGKTSTSSL
jgi:hypothetical protein